MPGVAVSHDVDIGSEAHRQAVEAAIHGTVKIPQDHVDVMESLRDSLGFERSVRQQAMGWKHKGGWKDVEANAVVTEGVWGVGIEGGIVVSDPVLGNLVTPKFVHRINLGMNRLKGRIPAGVFRVATLQELERVRKAEQLHAEAELARRNAEELTDTDCKVCFEPFGEA